MDRSAGTGLRQPYAGFRTAGYADPMADRALERLFILGAWHSAGSADWRWELRFRSAGRNTGNLLVGHAAHRQLKHAALGAMHTHRPEQVREHFDRIVVVATTS